MLRLLVICVPLRLVARGRYEMIVFVLSYAVLALLGLSLVGSVSAEIREPRARATRIVRLEYHRGVELLRLWS
jgi:hypothetical protein